MFKDRVAFVTGATGFVGCNIVEQLLRRDWKVTALFRTYAKAEILDRMMEDCELPRDRLTLVQGDVTDYQSLERAIPMDCDVVFHAAAVVDLANSPEVYELQYQANVEGTRNIVEACLKNNVRRIVYTSTISTFTDVTTCKVDDQLLTEETPQVALKSGSGYTRTKYMGERIVLDAMERGLEAVILHPGFVMGRYDKDCLGAICQYIGSSRIAFAGVGGGAFCDGEECAIAHIVAADKAANGSRYILGGTQYTWKQAVESMLKQYNLSDRYIWLIPRSVLVTYVKVWDVIYWLRGKKNYMTVGFMEAISTTFTCDSSKAQQDLGFKPKTIDEMTKSCIDWLKDNKDILQNGLLNK
eukprot:gene3648-4190_t